MTNKPTPKADPSLDLPAPEAPKEDEAQTWVVYTDAKGKTVRVKSEDYKDVT